MEMQTKTMSAWIARDFNGQLYYYLERPYRDETNDVWQLLSIQTNCGELPPELFPEITWENEPQKVEISIKII